ncbi:MAG: hypothetical protein ACLFVJ_05780 [Persicimonas sp.]
MTTFIEASNSRWALWLVLVVASMFVSTGARAGSEATTVRVVVAASAESTTGDSGEQFQRAKLDQITKQVADRLDTRLDAAQIKHFTVEVKDARIIEVRARGDISASLLAGLVIPAGAFEFRPVEPVGDQWMRRLPGLPEGVELRQPEGSMVSTEAYLWSRNERTLRQVIEDADLDGFELAVYPADGGWRTVAMGAPAVTHRDIEAASIRQSKTGQSHVRLDFKRAISDSRDSARVPGAWAAVVDGEIVTMWQRGDDRIGDALTLPAPSHLGSRSARLQWSRQVAGRLAAHIPVPMLEAGDED